GGDVEVLVDDGEGARQDGQGVLELPGVLGAVEPGAGGVGDLLERSIVSYQRVASPAEAAEPAEPAELRALADQGRGVGGTESDREDAHTAVGGLPRRGQRVDALVVRAVGEYDDRVVRISRTAAVVLGPGAGRRDGGVGLRDGVERGQDGLTDRGASSRGEA